MVLSIAAVGVLIVPLNLPVAKVPVLPVSLPSSRIPTLPASLPVVVTGLPSIRLPAPKSAPVKLAFEELSVVAKAGAGKKPETAGEKLDGKKVREEEVFSLPEADLEKELGLGAFSAR